MDLPGFDSFQLGHINIGLWLMASPLLLIASALLTALLPVWMIWAAVDGITYNPNAANAE